MPNAGKERPEPQVLLTVTYEGGMEERVIETLDALGVTGWTQVFDGHGSGGAGRKQNTPVWPGIVHILYIVLPETETERVANALRALQRSYQRNPGLTMWTQSVTLL